MKVLVIEDNLELARNMESFLRREGYVCETTHALDEARDKIVSFKYDCVMLDLMLPDGHGLELIEFMKDQRIESGILIVSAKNALDDRVRGLDLGADDYLTKPFHLTELNARLRAIFRRRNLNGERAISVNDLTINPDTMEAIIAGTPLDLTPKEFRAGQWEGLYRNGIRTRVYIQRVEMKIITRLTLYYLGVTLIVLLVGGFIVYNNVQEEVDKEESLELKGWLDNTARRIQNGT